MDPEAAQMAHTFWTIVWTGLILGGLFKLNSYLKRKKNEGK